jgi:signal transduction histidine kinase
MNSSKVVVLNRTEVGQAYESYVEYLAPPINAGAERNEFEGILGPGQAVRGALDQVPVVAPMDSMVMIEGETGTGREVIANAIHMNSNRTQDEVRVPGISASPKELLDSERLATIGRTASSISHDLRHYLSVMFANAEFMSDGSIAQSERDELFLEVRSAVHGITDLLDSLLLFTQNGRALCPKYESITLLIRRSVRMVRSHPGARDVKITLAGLSLLKAWVDAKKLERAVYNLLLNACQSARLGGGLAAVSLSLEEDEQSIHIRITDNGPGVSKSIRQTLFLPFVSEGRESGTGLGLTLALQIAQEHGGSVTLEDQEEGHTVFKITLPKAALQALGDAVEKRGHKII